MKWLEVIWWETSADLLTGIDFKVLYDYLTTVYTMGIITRQPIHLPVSFVINRVLASDWRQKWSKELLCAT